MKTQPDDARKTEDETPQLGKKLGKKVSHVQQDADSLKSDLGDSVFSEFDLYLHGQGSHDQIYNHFGAHAVERNGRKGVNFAVWAPNAKSVSVVGDFNNWNTDQHPLQPVSTSGIWEAFVPDVTVGHLYKYLVVDAKGNQNLKTDPYGFQAELPPKTASVVCELDSWTWNDDAWMKRREETNALEQPISIYEVHLGSWRQKSEAENGWMNYRTLAHQLVEYCQQMDFTHIELMPVAEHPYTGSWGYQITGYFSPTSRYGTPEDFMYFVDYFHQHNIGVIIDWVPAHFPRDAHGLASFDGTALYEHADPRQGAHPDWGTLIFNYGRNEVRNFLTSNALFWFDKYHIDGLRVDAVASMLYLDYSRDDGQWVPNKYGGRENLAAIELLKQVNERIQDAFPGALTIAEESTAWSGVSRPTSEDGLGFSFKWNMGWMNDTLKYMQHEPIHRKFHHDELTFSLVYAFSENFLLPFSHDEVVHGKGSLIEQMPGTEWQRFANLRLLYTYMWTHPGKKLLFMGSEFAQWDEWNCDDSIQWNLLQFETHQGIQKIVGDLNRVLKSEPALHQLDSKESGFQWINCSDSHSSVLSYLRLGQDDKEQVLTVCNFTPVNRPAHVIGASSSGQWEVIFNSDSEYYGGTNYGTGGIVETTDEPADGLDYRLTLDLPPLAGIMLKPVSASIKTTVE